MAKMESLGSRKKSQVKKQPLGLIIGIVLAVIVLGAASWYFLNNGSSAGQTPEQATTSYLAAYQHGDISTMKSLLSQSSIAMLGEGFDMSKFNQPKEGAGGSDKRFVISPATITGDTATVTVHDSEPQGAAVNNNPDMSYGLVKEGSAWKIDLQQLKKATN